MRKTVRIDCFFEQLDGYHQGRTMVAVDVIRATTTAVTGVSLGRRCFPVATLDEALRRADELDNPILAGELGGEMPYGFDLTNSPASVAERDDIERPMILLSTSGTRLITAGPSKVFVACLRNYEAQIEELSRHHPRVALVGAGTRGEFREEDQMCCAWIAEGLLERGYEAEDEKTLELVRRWAGASHDAFVGGKSSMYLRETNQLDDLNFIVGRVNDLNEVFLYDGGEIRPTRVGAPATPVG